MPESAERRLLCTGFRRGALALALCGVFFAAEWASAQEPATPRRRVRRRYDGAIQLHTMESAPAPVPTEEDKDDTPPREDIAPAAGLSPRPGGVNLPPPRLRMDRHPDGEEEKDDDVLWIVSPVTTLLGVRLDGTNTAFRANWGWLAEEIRGSMATNRAMRAAIERGEDPEETDEERQAEEEARVHRAPLIVEPSGHRDASSEAPVAEMPRFDTRLSSHGEPAVRPEPPMVRLGSARDTPTAPNIPSATSGVPEAPPGEASYPEAQRRMDELRSAHRLDTAPDWGTSSSAELSRTRLDAAAIAPPPSIPLPTERPLLSGSPDNYGRRGDIFSPSFRATSGDGLGAPPLASPWAAPAPAAATAPSPAGGLRPGGMAGYDPMQPFDPAGRALTEPRLRW